MKLFNSDPSGNSDRASASQAFLDSLTALEETFGDSGLADIAPDLSIADSTRSASMAAEPKPKPDNPNHPTSQS